VNLVSTTTGAGTDYGVSISIADTESAINPTLFPSPSFSASGSDMWGGASAGSSYGKIYSYQVLAGGYAPNGNILTHVDSVMGTWNFSYDGVDRIASATQTAYTATSQQYAGKLGCWTYDSYGNRTLEAFSPAACNNTPTPQMGASYNAANNQILSTWGTTWATLTYDASGNTANDGNNRYWYDAEGQLCAVQSIATSSITAYVYDAEGARVAKGPLSSAPAAGATCAPLNAYGSGLTSSQGFTLTARYLVDLGGDQVTELNGSGVWRHSNVWSGGRLTATYDTVGLRYALADPLGTKRVQANVLGQVDEYCTSLPFGNDLGNNLGVNCSAPANSLATNDDATEHHFTQKERDTESGNDYFFARYYSSALGRFTTPDWSGKEEPVPYARLTDPQSLNLYAYVGNNPVLHVDPDGHDFIKQMNQDWIIKHAISNPDAGLMSAAGVHKLSAQQQSDKNTNVMMMANSGSGPSANPHPSTHGMDGTAYMDWAIVPQADNISQLSNDSIKATQAQYSKATISLDESKPGGKEHWEGSDTGKGHDNINPMALPVTQKWYINTGNGNQRIQLVIGMKPDGTLIKAWTVQVTAGPAYKKED
jgi:RHS repeat-associated protein